MKPPLNTAYSNDFQTPPIALKPLIPYLKKEWVLWEPAKGKGNLTKELRRLGFEVIGSDILTGHDFLKWQPEKWDCIITNPPFCYDSDTETLTRNGWKLIKDVSVGEKVLSLNPHSLLMEWSKVENVINSYYTGKMIHFKQRFIDLLVTPNHRIYAVFDDKTLAVKRRLYGKNRVESDEIISAEDVTRSHHLRRTGFKWKGKQSEFFILPRTTLLYNKQQKTFEEIKIKIEDWLAFFGLWIAEGSSRGSKKKEGENHKGKQKHLYEISIKQKEPRAQIVRSMLNNLPFNIRETKYPNGMCNFSISSVQLWKYLHQFGNSRTKFIPTYIKNLSPRLLNILFEWYMFGDGYSIFHKNKVTTRKFSTVSKRLADDLMEISIKLGKLVSCYKKEEGYSVTIAKQGLALLKHRKSQIQYSGMIYCLNLKKNNIFLVRRNGKTAFSGNSLKQQFLERCYELSKPFALLLPLTTFETEKRQNLFKKYGVEIIFFDKRINFETPSGRGSGSWFATAWFTHGLNIGKELNFVKLDGFEDKWVCDDCGDEE